MPRVDAILFTHSHADHILGLDDIRRFNFMQGGPIPATRARRPGTAFDGRSITSSTACRARAAAFPSSTCTRSTVRSRSPAIHVVPVPLCHGTLPILGFRFGNFAYLTDCSGIPDDRGR